MKTSSDLQIFIFEKNYLYTTALFTALHVADRLRKSIEYFQDQNVAIYYVFLWNLRKNNQEASD